jgi:hypothetical protein
MIDGNGILSNNYILRLEEINYLLADNIGRYFFIYSTGIKKENAFLKALPRA